MTPKEAAEKIKHRLAFARWICKDRPIKSFPDFTPIIQQCVDDATSELRATHDDELEICQEHCDVVWELQLHEKALLAENAELRAVVDKVRDYIQSEKMKSRP